MRLDCKFSFFCFLIALGVVSCAPSRKERQYGQTQIDFGPQRQDAQLDLDKMESSFVKKVGFKGEFATAKVLKMIEDLQVYGQKTQSVSILKSSVNQLNNLESSKGIVGKINISDSPYFQAAVGETEEQALKEIENVILILKKDQDTIASVIPEFSGGESSKIQDLLVLGKAYLIQFSQAIDVASIDDRVRKNIKSELNNYSLKIDNQLQPLVERYSQLTDVSEKIKIIEEAIRQLAIQLPASDQKLLASVKQIDQTLKKAKAEQDILDAIIQIWEILNPQDREKVFKEKSKELYSFLEKRSEKQLNCLKNEDCFGFYTSLARAMKILPKIKEIGVENLRQDISTSLKVKVDEKLSQSIQEMLSRVPVIIKEKVQTGIEAKQNDLKRISKDYAGHIEEMLQSWAKTEIGNETVNVFENDLVQVDQASTKQVSYKIQPKENRDLIYLETLGQSFSTNAHYLESLFYDNSIKKETSLRILQQINRMLALSGYKDSSGSQVPAFAIPVSPSQKIRSEFNIKTFLKSETSFVFPDQVYTDGARSIDYGHIMPNLTVQSQASLLHGLSHMIIYLQDWRENSFDQALSEVTTAKFMQTSIGADVNRPLFPKDSLLALAVANSSVILSNLMKDLTPVFLLNSQSRLIWANEFDFTSGNAATMAGVVNIRGLQREKKVYAQDLARYIIALSQFLNATQDIEKTKSTLLKTKVEGQESPVETLVKSREKIKLLIIGLSNFLTHQMGGRGLIVDEISVHDTGDIESTASLMTQVYSIEALIEAYRQTKVAIYKNSAIDTYFLMNHKLFNKNIGLYDRSVNKSETIQHQMQLPDVARVLKVLKDLEEVIPQDNHRQLQKIMLKYQQVIENTLN